MTLWGRREGEDALLVDVAGIPSAELLERMPELVRGERTASGEVVAHLVEIHRRQVYLQQACSSLYTYCIERLGYSEDEALRRPRVARLASKIPRVLEELSSGAIHLTGLLLLSQHLTEANADALLGEARGKSRRGARGGSGALVSASARTAASRSATRP